MNCHTRIIKQPIEKVAELFCTLATPHDKIWPSENWPAMRFNDGLHVGSFGGHGPVKYKVIEMEMGKLIIFKFVKPDGFNGTHQLSIDMVSDGCTEVRHVIDMSTNFKASLLWLFVIRWLHNALIEEAFDNIENFFSDVKKTTKYNLWVRFLRKNYQQKPTKSIITH